MAVNGWSKHELYTNLHRLAKSGIPTRRQGACMCEYMIAVAVRFCDSINPAGDTAGCSAVQL